jgi:hypothetical protein
MTLQSLVAYGKGFQLKVINALLTDKTFLLNVRSVIEESYFDSDTHKWIVREVLKYYDSYHTTLTPDVLRVELQKVDNELLKVAIKEELKNAIGASKDDLEYVIEEFTRFCRNQKMKAAILASADLLRVGDFDGIRTMVEQAIKAGLDQHIGHEYNIDVESRYRKDYRPVIPTPWPMLSELIQGGMGPGDLIVIFGNPGGGKCVSASTEIEIEYEEYCLELEGSDGKPYRMFFEPWDEFNIDGTHLYGWQAYKLLEATSNVTFVQRD